MSRRLPGSLRLWWGRLEEWAIPLEIRGGELRRAELSEVLTARLAA